jgi:hypothetical protein
MKQLTVSDANGKKYTLEYSKNSIIRMERQGFDINEFNAKPMSMITMLVEGAFYKNHSGVKTEKVEEIYYSLKDKEAFLGKLIEMYKEQADELVGEGNAEWEANW